MTDHCAAGRSRHDSTFLVRSLFWLFALFSIAETPLGKGDLFGAAGVRLDTSRLEISSGDLPSRHSTAGTKQRKASLVEYCREFVSGYAAEDSGAEAALAPTDVAPCATLVGAAVPPAPAPGRLVAHRWPGFASRAPPVFT